MTGIGAPGSRTGPPPKGPKIGSGQRKNRIRVGKVGITSSMAPAAYGRAVAVDGSKKARYARRRQKRMERVEHDLTAEQWLALQRSWGGCAYCGVSDTSLQKDCVLAISRGGRYTVDNVVPACRACNASKCNDEVTGWLRRKKLDERNFLVRHHEICSELRRG